MRRRHTFYCALSLAYHTLHSSPVGYIGADWFSGCLTLASSGPGLRGKPTPHFSTRAGQTVKKTLNCMCACRTVDEGTCNRTRACARSMHGASLRAWDTVTNQPLYMIYMILMWVSTCFIMPSPHYPLSSTPSSASPHVRAILSLPRSRRPRCLPLSPARARHPLPSPHRGAHGAFHRRARGSLAPTLFASAAIRDGNGYIPFG